MKVDELKKSSHDLTLPRS